MPEPAIDHRRATAERNGAAIMAATERLLAQRKSLNMAAIATEAGLSRPTLYAHYATIGEVVEAAVERAVGEAAIAVDAAAPETGPAPEALTRMIEASWNKLAGLDDLGRAVAEHLSSEHVHRTHAPLMKRLAALTERGREDGSFRTDLPVVWLVTSFYALVHAAHDAAHVDRMSRPDALEAVTTTIQDIFAAR